MDGKYEPLILKKIFLKVNERKYCSTGSKHNSEFERTPLKMFLKCDVCEEYLRGYLAKAKGLYYYKCHTKKKCSCNRSAIELHKKFGSILAEMALDEKYVPLFKLQMQTIFYELNENRDKVNGPFQKQLLELNQKVERLEERFVNEELRLIYMKNLAPILTGIQ